MNSHWVNGCAGYRCRHRNTGLQIDQRQATLYVREDHLITRISRALHLPSAAHPGMIARRLHANRIGIVCHVDRVAISGDFTTLAKRESFSTNGLGRKATTKSMCKQCVRGGTLAHEHAGSRKIREIIQMTLSAQSPKVNLQLIKLAGDNGHGRASRRDLVATLRRDRLGCGDQRDSLPA